MKSLALAAAVFGLAGAALAQSGTPMTQEELVALSDGGATIMLGGPDAGYSGTLDLMADGSGKGEATTDDGKKLTLTGTWHVADGKFCRSWAEFGDGEEVCETWIKTGERSADVMVGDDKVGVNSW